MQVRFNGQPRNFEDPNICPHCHVTNTPHHIWYGQSVQDSSHIIISTWNCANVKCKKLIVAQNVLSGATYVFQRFLNGLPKGPIWPKPIVELKSAQSTDQENPENSRFIKTYLQSLEAENHGLDELAGMGYRKAIEYLVKDWAVKKNPDKKKKLKHRGLAR